MARSGWIRGPGASAIADQQRAEALDLLRHAQSYFLVTLAADKNDEPHFYAVSSIDSMEGHEINVISHFTQKVIDIVGRFAKQSAETIMEIGFQEFEEGEADE